MLLFVTIGVVLGSDGHLISINELHKIIFVKLLYNTLKSMLHTLATTHTVATCITVGI